MYYWRNTRFHAWHGSRWARLRPARRNASPTTSRHVLLDSLHEGLEAPVALLQAGELGLPASGQGGALHRLRDEGDEADPFLGRREGLPVPLRVAARQERLEDLRPRGGGPEAVLLHRVGELLLVERLPRGLHRRQERRVGEALRRARLPLHARHVDHLLPLAAGETRRAARPPRRRRPSFATRARAPPPSTPPRRPSSRSSGSGRRRGRPRAFRSRPPSRPSSSPRRARRARPRGAAAPRGRRAPAPPGRGPAGRSASGRWRGGRSPSRRPRSGRRAASRPSPSRRASPRPARGRGSTRGSVAATSRERWRLSVRG